MKLYNVDYFLNKFDAIPDDQWTTQVYQSSLVNAHCALGHCGETVLSSSVESTTLSRILEMHLDAFVIFINDGHSDYADLGDTPKERIMNALILIKAGVSVQETKGN